MRTLIWVLIPLNGCKGKKLRANTNDGRRRTLSFLCFFNNYAVSRNYSVNRSDLSNGYILRQFSFCILVLGTAIFCRNRIG